MIESTVVLDDGFKVGVTQVGQGTPLVFMHGLAVSAGTYAELLYALADRGFAVTALDAADHGRTDALPWGHTVADMAEVHARALTQLGVDRAIMAAHSMGGSMAVEFAARYPERTSDVILIDAAVGQPHHDAIRVEPSVSLPIRAAQFIAGATWDMIGDSVTAVCSRSHTERLSLFHVLRRSIPGPRSARAAYALMQADTAPALRYIRAAGIPTVVLHGTNDHLVPYAAGAAAAKAAGGTCIPIQGAYHSWPIAQPRRAADAIAYILIDPEWSEVA